jgi:hypothetical protein
MKPKIGDKVYGLPVGNEYRSRRSSGTGEEHKPTEEEVGD